MELEFFCSQEEKKTKQVPLARSELPHYARKTTDLYFQYHFGWGEVSSISDRGNYDLSQHSQHSQKDLSINRVIPQVIEVSFGVERLMLAMLEDSYREEAVKNSEAENKERKVLKLHPLLSPYFVAIIPLSKQLKESAYQLYLNLLSAVPFNLTYEEAPNVGKAYRRQDAIGTYYCLTVDFETSHDNMITCRQRDTMKQVRIKIKDIKNYLYTEYETHFQNRQKAQEIRFEKDQEKLAEKVKDASQSEIFFINERNLAKKKKLLSRLLLNDCNPKLTAKQKSQIDNYLKNLDIAPVDYNELATQELTPTEEKLKNHGVEMIEPEGFTNPKESSKEKVVLGLTTTDKQEIRIITDGPRIGTDSDGNPKEVNDLNYSDISWETLTETIAHELAHAIVNTLMYDGKPMLDDGGHGPLHDDFTHRMKTKFLTNNVAVISYQLEQARTILSSQEVGNLASRLAVIQELRAIILACQRTLTQNKGWVVVGRDITSEQKNLVYLDSAATSLKPNSVIQAVRDYYEKYSINSHSSGSNRLAQEVQSTIQQTRQLIAQKINARPEEIIFLPSTTYALNILALSLKNHLEKGDKIFLTHLEHTIAQEKEVQVNFLPLNKNFTIDINVLGKYIDKKTKIVSFVHMSNNLGVINPVQKITQKIKELNPNCLVIIDACQRGGKKFGPLSLTSGLSVAQKFEVGTLPLAQIFGLKKSLEFLNSLDIQEISNYEKELKDYAVKELAKLENIIIYNKNLETVDIVLFNWKDYHAHDIAEYLGKNNICVRTGDFCCPYLKELIGVESAVRISLFIYNTKDDIDKLICHLKKIKKEPELLTPFPE
ncbi:12331_t:CDS:10 [Entrophospora sp. SA101]|nr:12331_t:CDS:10 [Entrophospora sp. SA101]